MAEKRLLFFGYGYAAQALARGLRPDGWRFAATVRPGGAPPAETDVLPVSLDDAEALDRAVGEARAILISAPPTDQGCPGLAALAPALARANAFPDWIGYLSSTGVYGDRGGGWVFEQSRLAAQSPEGARRAAAEREWLDVGRGMGLTVCVFRLPGIYGPGRSAFERLRAGTATRRDAPGQVFSRIHVDDLAAGLAASMAHPAAGRAYNLCDDEPASASAVTAHAAGLLGIEPPPETPLDLDALSPSARRFYAESKRVSNARAKAELGWRPAYATYREGLKAVLAAGG